MFACFVPNFSEGSVEFNIFAGLTVVSIVINGICSIMLLILIFANLARKGKKIVDKIGTCSECKEGKMKYDHDEEGEPIIKNIEVEIGHPDAMIDGHLIKKPKPYDYRYEDKK